MQEEIKQFLSSLWDITLRLMPFVALAILAYWVSVGLIKLLKRKNEKSVIYPALLKYCQRPAFFLLLCLFLLPGLQSLPITESVHGWVEVSRQTVGLLLIAMIAWLVIRSTEVLEDVFIQRYDVSAKDNLTARKIHTQFSFFKKAIIVVVLIITVSCMLMTFEKVRQLGVSILGSAGIAGIVIGFAAQRSIATFIAGMQIAVTQPIRIDDVVIVEGEWGRIEEITMTYVVVRIWDLRRLVVPIGYFIEKPFQNWTRVSADLLGSVVLYVDYRVPVDKVRAYYLEIIEQSEKWDRKVACLQVVDCTDRAVQLRALMSAADASAAWDLRCEIREKLLGWLNTHYPDSLPRVRAEIESEKSTGH